MLPRFQKSGFILSWLVNDAKRITSCGQISLLWETNFVTPLSHGFGLPCSKDGTSKSYTLTQVLSSFILSEIADDFSSLVMLDGLEGFYT